MSALGTLALVALLGVSSCAASNCTYLSLLSHFNLTTTNELLQIMRPVKNWNQTTGVSMDMVLWGILKVDEKSQTVTTHIWFQMAWTNEFLTWNPSDFCGINMLTVPRSKLWIPDISIQEDVSDSGSTLHSPLLRFYPNGLTFANSRQKLTSTCQLNLYLFPYDVQLCNITFTSLNYNDGTIDLGTMYGGTILSSISEKLMVTQGEWELGRMEVVRLEKDSRLVYMVKIIRKPMLYVINFIVPLFYFLALDLASFFISDATGEKMNFKVTILLSISVLLLLLQDMLPSTEDRLPVIATYCISVFTLVGISVLEAMLVSFLMELDAAGWRKAQSSAHDPRDVQVEAAHQKEAAAAEEKDPVDPVNPVKTRLPVDWPSDLDLLRLILQEVQAARQEAGKQDKERRKPGRYERAAEIIDTVFFFVYFLTVVVFSVCMYLVWFRKSDPDSDH